MAAIKALEQWCKMQCDGYRDVAITNMTSSFKNGLAFCALIHKYRPDLIDYDSLSKEDVFENNHLAFRVAEEKLGIPALLDAEDMVALRVPDRLSILTYVSQYRNYFKGHSPTGGVKRPAEGSKEELSKKNLPVVAKTCVSTTVIENCLPGTLTETSTTLDKTGVQKTVLFGNGNKTGTLNSKCVACNCHVHLVQRHFVDGNLYHRICFKCSECSTLLHAGAYKAGKEPDTFICKTHRAHNSCKPSNNGPSSSLLQPKVASHIKSMSRLSSVLATPVNVPCKPVAAPTGCSWTVSAQKTQEARQRFFQAAPTSHREPSVLPKVSDRPKTLKGPEEKNICRPAKLAEENCNNNNACHFVIRSAKRRFEGDNNVGMRHNESGPCPAENQAGHLSTRDNDHIMEPRCTKVITERRRPTPLYTNAKDPVLHDWRSNLKPVKKDPDLRSPDAGPAIVEQHKPELALQLHSSISLTTTKSPSDLIAKVSPVTPQCSAVWYVKPSSQKPDPGPDNWSFNHERSSPTASLSEGLTIAVTGPTKTHPNTGDPWTSCSSDSKRGRYLSPTNASMPEMRSPPVKSPHILMDQLVKELQEIETKMSLLEKEGVILETKLRSYETEGEGDILMDPLMVEWFSLIRKKQMYIRKESELIYIARTQDLEQQQPGVEGELRMLLEIPDDLKSSEDQCREQRLLDRLVEIVNRRNAIVEVLDEDRLREVEEDHQLNKMMRDLGVKQSKYKRKSSISKLFRHRSKKEVK